MRSLADRTERPAARLPAREQSAGDAVDWRACARIAHAHGRTFAFASRFLPPERRRAILAAYAYCRVADDIADRTTDLETAARALDDWERQLDDPIHPVAVAFSAARRQYGVSKGAAVDLLTGVRMDLAPRRFETWDELRRYCYHVAGTVGLMAAPMLGCADDAALPYAVELGIAMQLTNILRDVGEDASRNRLYLPLDELQAFGCDPESILDGKPNGHFADLLAFEIARARRLYAGAWRGLPALAPSGRLTTLAASRLYAAILDAIEEQRYDVFDRRACVPLPRKLAALPGIAVAFVDLALQAPADGNVS